MTGQSVQLATPPFTSKVASHAPVSNRRENWAHFWLTTFFQICNRVPWIAQILKRPALWFTWHCSRSIRQVTAKNTRWLIGPSSTRSDRIKLSKAILSRFFDSVLELGANHRRSNTEFIARVESTHGRDGYAAARASKAGAILVTAHLGSFETAIALLSSFEKNIHIVFQRDRFPVFERMRSRQHARLGVIEAPVDEGLSTWFSLRAALLRDEVVLMQADRVMPGQRGVLVPFMGGKIEIPAGPVKLAEATGAPIIPVFAITTPDGRVRIEINDPIWLRDFPGHLVSDGNHPAILKIAAAIESVVKAHPDQWLCLHSAWIEDPTSSQQPI